MEIVSRINTKIRHCREIEIYPYLYDHHIEGKTVLPAVEALMTLAGAVKSNHPRAAINSITGAVFPRFLTILPNTKSMVVSVEIQEVAAGVIAAALLTPVKSPKGNISRLVECARAKFTDLTRSQLPGAPFNDPEKLTGECINIPADTIYNELVPFGAAYRNITGDLSVSRNGALAYVSGGKTSAADELLGSPFPFDAILHAACVWGQRFAGIVPFPTGFSERIIYRKTEKKVAYLGRIVPVNTSLETLIFNAWIYDLSGAICEVISGIQMRDVSRGTRKPPVWIKECV
jgi:hypothetical protein